MGGGRELVGKKMMGKKIGWGEEMMGRMMTQMGGENCSPQEL